MDFNSPKLFPQKFQQDLFAKLFYSKILTDMMKNNKIKNVTSYNDTDSNFIFTFGIRMKNNLRKHPLV